MVLGADPCDVAQPGEHGTGGAGQPLVGTDVRALPAGRHAQGGQERAESEQERRPDQHPDHRRGGGQADGRPHGGDDEAAHDDDQAGVRVADDLHLVGQPGHGPVVGAAGDAPAQRSAHHVPDEVVAERLDQVPEPPVHLSGPERADPGGPQECGEPGEPDERPAGEETGVHGPGHGQAGQGRGHRLGHRPGEERRRGPAPQRR